MIRIENLKNVIEKIQEQTADINADKFLIRVKYCYSNDDKAKYEKEYEVIKNMLSVARTLPYRSVFKENFYIGKCDVDFEKIEDFNILRKSIEKKDGEIITVTVKNLNIYHPLLQTILDEYVEVKEEK